MDANRWLSCNWAVPHKCFADATSLWGLWLLPSSNDRPRLSLIMKENAGFAFTPRGPTLHENKAQPSLQTHRTSIVVRVHLADGFCRTRGGSSRRDRS